MPREVHRDERDGAELLRSQLPCVYNCSIGYTYRMSAAKTLLTAEQFDNYPFEEDKRYELDEGELIEMTRPAYRHNRVLAKLLFALTAYLEKNPIGEALISEN